MLRETKNKRRDNVLFISVIDIFMQMLVLTLFLYAIKSKELNDLLNDIKEKEDMARVANANSVTSPIGDKMIQDEKNKGGVLSAPLIETKNKNLFIFITLIQYPNVKRGERYIAVRFNPPSDLDDDNTKKYEEKKRTLEESFRSEFGRELTDTEMIPIDDFKKIFKNTSQKGKLVFANTTTMGKWTDLSERDDFNSVISACLNRILGPSGTTQ